MGTMPDSNELAILQSRVAQLEGQLVTAQQKVWPAVAAVVIDCIAAQSGCVACAHTTIHAIIHRQMQLSSMPSLPARCVQRVRSATCSANTNPPRQWTSATTHWPTHMAAWHPKTSAWPMKTPPCRRCVRALDTACTTTPQHVVFPQELGQAKASIHKLKSAVVEKDAAVERAAVEVHIGTPVDACTNGARPHRSTPCVPTTAHSTRCCSRSRASWMLPTPAWKPTWYDTRTRRHGHTSAPSHPDRTKWWP